MQDYPKMLYRADGAMIVVDDVDKELEAREDDFVDHWDLAPEPEKAPA